MRRVYSPPKDEKGWGLPLAVSGLLSLGVFLVLPLTQMASSGLRKDLTLMRVDTAQMEAPEVEPEEPPPPPEPEPEEPPPPELNEAPPPMNLNVSLDVAVGTGGALAMGAGGWGAGVEDSLLDAFDVSDLDRRPEAISQVAPAYPSELRKARVEGTVTLVFVLGEDGRVEDPRVESASRPEFERPALEAIRKWRFKPGMKDGEPVRTYLRLPMRFRVTEG
jgi:protein TonB